MGRSDAPRPARPQVLSRPHGDHPLQHVGGPPLCRGDDGPGRDPRGAMGAIREGRRQTRRVGAGGGARSAFHHGPHPPSPHCAAVRSPRRGFVSGMSMRIAPFGGVGFGGWGLGAGVWGLGFGGWGLGAGVWGLGFGGWGLGAGVWGLGFGGWGLGAGVWGLGFGGWGLGGWPTRDMAMG